MIHKPLVLSDIRARAGAFVADWRDAEGYERGEAQEFVRGLLGVFGISGRTAAVYERRAQRASTGQRGFIDALISGTALIEMKSRGRDLIDAERQALDYIESLTEHERPDYVITSDFQRFRLLDLTAEPGEDSILEFTLEDLPAHVEDLMFLAGYRRTKFGSAEQAAASITAAQLMAKLYEHLEKTGYDEHQASIFLVRTLFCLYADDAGLWERDLFSRYLEERTSEDGSDLGAQLATLFQAVKDKKARRELGGRCGSARPPPRQSAGSGPRAGRLVQPLAGRLRARVPGRVVARDGCQRGRCGRGVPAAGERAAGAPRDSSGGVSLRRRRGTAASRERRT